MERNQPISTDVTTSRVTSRRNQLLFTKLLDSISAATPLQILPSKIKGAGTGLFTTKDVENGEEIFRSCPVVNCVMDGMQKLVCDNCYAYQDSKVIPSGRFRKAGEPKLEMKACKGCSVCYYCSKTCQRKAWKRYHKHECTIFSETPNMPARTRALYRLLNMDKLQLLSRETWSGLYGLQPHIKEHLTSTNCVAILGARKSARDRTGTDRTSDEVLTLYCTVLTNCLSIYQAEGKMLGTSLDIITSLVNHSCDPNAFVVFEGNSLCVRSMRKLSAGEEITQCYTDVDTNVLLRQEMLKSEYFFDCCCERCEKQMKTQEQRFPGMIEQIQQSQQQLIDLTNEAVHLNDISSLEIEAQDIAKHVFPGGHWPRDLQPWPAMRILFAQELRARGRLMEAMKQGIIGYLFFEPRTGDTWIRHLLDLTQFISRVLVGSDWKTPRGGPGFLTESQLWDVLHGYLHELSLCAIKTFGARSEYAQAIQAWYSDCMKCADAPLPGTRAFAQKFETTQSRLLLWAGVDEGRGIALG
ncbi:hypothetical protein C7974DRAFT_74191 [Boeremia exigua]|uniref:uncharacterized protein n=1 Tax=Boeremia exigua TaxID=749465 RepID=UPI001E8D35A6|nr:uncharacterized protein C7974DRAFT_74191 [Boeremia exigua]KAH6614323.1 hypothetical protein C7974DRAFT_74191 [Boeremia exigua]